MGVVIGFVYPEYDFASIPRTGSRVFDGESRIYFVYRENMIRNREILKQNREIIRFIARF
ncbi:hypothetical protein [Lederbergia graminis]|uniref:Uncharacterized protein n=1 Tax=Lederbergia graminis TaxID=735518 RepID=A0ABW0LHE5_9BACI